MNNQSKTYISIHKEITGEKKASVKFNVILWTAFFVVYGIIGYLLFW